MSFVDSIFSGISHAVKGVFGNDDQPTPREESTGRSTDLARNSKTTYAFDPRTSSSTSLIDQLQSRVGQRNTTPDAGQPMRGESAPAATTDAETPATRGVSAETRIATPVARARVLDASTNSELGTVDTLDASQPASVAARNVQRGLDYYATTFGRNGLDNAGSGVDVLIDDRSTTQDGTERFKGNGGYYSMPDATGVTTEAIHFGTGDSYDAANGRVDQGEMFHADDLSIHELTHGIIRMETGQLGGEADEAGATNEGIADVMAASATRDWKIGEGMYTDRSDYRMMRDISNPDDPTAIHGLWTNTSQVESARAANQEIEEHWASGVISTAAYRVQQRLGGEAGWNAVERVFYDAIDRNLLGDMSFDAVAGALRTSASALYGDGSQQAQAFDQELVRGGM